MEDMNQTTTTTTTDRNELYDIRAAAKILGLKVDTLRYYIRHQHRVVPQRQGKRKLVLTAADLLRLWDEIAFIRSK